MPIKIEADTVEDLRKLTGADELAEVKARELILRAALMQQRSLMGQPMPIGSDISSLANILATPVQPPVFPSQQPQLQIPATPQTQWPQPQWFDQQVTQLQPHVIEAQVQAQLPQTQFQVPTQPTEPSFRKRSLPVAVASFFWDNPLLLLLILAGLVMGVHARTGILNQYLKPPAPTAETELAPVPAPPPPPQGETPPPQN